MSLENIHPENLSNINTLDPIMHKKLDLIRRLENLGFIFAINPKVATEQACSSDGTPTDKLKASYKVPCTKVIFGLRVQAGYMLASRLWLGLLGCLDCLAHM